MLQDTYRIQPPSTITYYWCPECGRFRQLLTSKHYVWGKLCKGTAQTVVYAIRERRQQRAQDSSPTPAQ